MNAYSNPRHRPPQILSHRSEVRGSRYYDPPLPSTAPPFDFNTFYPRRPRSTRTHVLAAIAMALSLALVIYVHHAEMVKAVAAGLP